MVEYMGKDIQNIDKYLTIHFKIIKIDETSSILRKCITRSKDLERLHEVSTIKDFGYI